MNLIIIGTGYVGLVSGACFAETGNHVECIDIDRDKIENLNAGIIPIYEPGLESLVNKNVQANRLNFATELPQEIPENSILLIAVGTPPTENGEADLSYVFNAAKSIGSRIKNYVVIVDKSTVPVGTGDKVEAIIQSELSKREVDCDFDVVSNPEFLKEGDAIKDFLYPDRVIIGSDSIRAKDIISQLFAPYSMKKTKILFMGRRDAEMSKYAANAMLATKISFMNEIAVICERMGVDVEKVRKGIGSDSRIGYSFIFPGCGYGGSCFPKDVKAIINTAKHSGVDPVVLNAVEQRNSSQKNILFEKLTSLFGTDLTGKTFSVWGLSFKPGTDDMREAPSVKFVNSVVKCGGSVNVYDPVCQESCNGEFEKELFNSGKIKYCENEFDALENSEALILITEWIQFRQPDFQKIKNLLKNPIIIDGRNQYKPDYLQDLGIDYYGIGRSNRSQTDQLLVKS